MPRPILQTKPTNNGKDQRQFKEKTPNHKETSPIITYQSKESDNVIFLTNHTTKKSENLKFFVTQDQNQKDQYYKLRDQVYREENGWSDYYGLECEYDKAGHIVVAVDGDEVVGGMRLMFSGECHHLSNEIPGTQYDYKKFIKKYDEREDILISEISGVVIKKPYRDRSVTIKSFDLILKLVADRNYDYIFGVGVLAVCRDYRVAFEKLGHRLEIIINFPWLQKKLYNFSRMFPMYVNMSEPLSTKQKS